MFQVHGHMHNSFCIALLPHCRNLEVKLFKLTYINNGVAHWTMRKKARRIVEKPVTSAKIWNSLRICLLICRFLINKKIKLSFNCHESQDNDYLWKWNFPITPHVGLSVGWLVGRLVGWSPFWAAALKGLMTYAFTLTGNFSFSIHPPPLKAQILALRPKS